MAIFFWAFFWSPAGAGTLGTAVFERIEADGTGVRFNQYAVRAYVLGLAVVDALSLSPIVDEHVAPRFSAAIGGRCLPVQIPQERLQ